MDVCLLKSTFAGNGGTKPTSLHPTNTGKTVTTDNTQPVTQEQAVAEPSKNFRQTLGKKITTKTSRNAHANQPDDKKRKKSDQGSETLSDMVHLAKSPAVQGVPTRPVILNKAVNAKILNRFQQQAESQIQGKSARLIADPPPRSSTKASSLVAHTAKPITSEPDQIVSTITKPANKPIQLTIDQSQIKSEIISPAVPESPLITNAQSERSEDAGKMQIPQRVVMRSTSQRR